MNDYPDTSFLCALYRQQENSERALKYRARMAEALHLSTLLEFEFLQSIRLQVWLHSRDRKKGYTQLEADEMCAAWEVDRASGKIIVASYDAEVVTRLAGSLSLAHTSGGGHRTLDVLHVATALHLRAKNFLTFDARQNALAKRSGLKSPL